MQTTQEMPAERLAEIIHAIYQDGCPNVWEAYSDFDQPLRRFPVCANLLADLVADEKRKCFHYAIHYPAAKGHVTERRIDLKPEAVPGFTHRFEINGWGLICLQCTFLDSNSIQVRIAVNSETRAMNWSSIYPELADPEAWDWTVVGRHAGRLVRLLRKIGKGK